MEPNRRPVSPSTPESVREWSSFLDELIAEATAPILARLEALERHVGLAADGAELPAPELPPVD